MSASRYAYDMKHDHQTERKQLIYLPELFSDAPSLPRMLYESGRSASEVADIIGCDRRTAARLIRENLDISDIGKWNHAHKKLDTFTGMINSFIDTKLKGYTSLSVFSRDLFHDLQKKGYTGSERTLRNYLSRQERVYQYFYSINRTGEHIYAERNEH